MIPISLTLKNFLSYGPTLQTIDFAPYALICLSGKNGHGKSALLDAMTWAVWGQARKTAGATKADDGLLRLSEHEMIVIFEFMSGNNQYRVKREFFRSGNKGLVTLDFGIIENRSDKTIPLTGKTIRETQAIIEKTIGLDFETFVNSAFLRQGGSSEFSKKSPRERKEILARILSLDQYEIIKKGALEKIKVASIALESTKLAQEKRNEEKKGYLSVDEFLATTSVDLLEVTKQEEQIKKQIAQQQYMLTQVISEKMFYQAETTKKRQLQEEKLALSTQLKKMRIEWQSCIAVCIEMQKIIPLYQKKEALTNFVALQKELLHQKMLLQQTLSSLNEKKQHIIREYEIKNQQLQEQYVVQRESLKNTIVSDRETIKTITNELTIIDRQEKEHCDHSIVVKEKIIVSKEKKNDILFLLQRAEKRISLLDKIVTKKTYHLSIFNDIEKKLSLLCDEQCATCPICDHELSPEKRNQLHKSIEKEKIIVETKLTRLTKIQSRLEPFNAFHKEYKKQELEKTKQLQTLLEQQSESNLIQAQLKEKKIQLQTQLSQLQTRVQETTKQSILLHEQFFLNQQIVTTDASYNQIMNEIAKIQTMIQENTYNEQQYIAANQELKALEACFIKNDEQMVKQNMFMTKERIKSICLAIKKNNQEQSKCFFIQDKLQALEEKETIVSQKTKQGIAELTLLQQKKEELAHQKGTLEAKQKIVQVITMAYDQAALNIQTLQKEVDQYTIIANTTGKDGIQALLIEQAVPEIEYEANSILSRLTNNQMQLFIESIKDLKSGKMKETLDIKISDAEGMRPYDLFSGGEAFRIDLALRIGISKLLANRAGTTLETLIIDEGFGSQDEEGIALVVESLYKIQDNFKKIIIVSHLTNIKEQIPVHFVVSKGAHGSTVQVMEG